MAIKSLVLVGGVYGDNPRSSGFVSKFQEALTRACPSYSVSGINGGSFETLVDYVALLKSSQETSVVVWMADVPNHFPKLLANFIDERPNSILIQSKNNREGKYSPHALLERANASGSELLIEFTGDSVISSNLYCRQQLTPLIGTSDILSLAFAVSKYLESMPCTSPIQGTASLSADSMSFQQKSPGEFVEIPTFGHVGSFGHTRANHIHEGIDLYAPHGTPVYAMESGIVVYVGAFTGHMAGSPWWNLTYCVMVEGSSGVINYGEIAVDSSIQEGVSVSSGQRLGSVSQVLKIDKGRPMSMLHLERYVAGTKSPVKEWQVGKDRPSSLISPLSILISAYKDF